MFKIPTFIIISFIIILGLDRFLKNKYLNMINFKTDGIYIHKFDLNNDGIFKKNNDGTLKKMKYGFFDKLFDILKYGKTLSIGYSYIYFSDKQNGLTIYIGSQIGELTDILSSLKYQTNSYNKVSDYEKINQNQIIVKNDKIGTTNEIITFDNGNSLIFYFHNLYDNKKDQHDYSFINFLN
jgi:hypothetical protein